MTHRNRKKSNRMFHCWKSSRGKKSEVITLSWKACSFIPSCMCLLECHRTATAATWLRAKNFHSFTMRPPSHDSRFSSLFGCCCFNDVIKSLSTLLFMKNPTKRGLDAKSLFFSSSGWSNGGIVMTAKKIKEKRSNKYATHEISTRKEKSSWIFLVKFRSWIHFWC